MFEFFFRGGRGVSADLETPFSIFLEYFYKWELPDRPAPAPVAGYVPRNDIVKQSMLNSRRGHFYTMTNCTTSLYGSGEGVGRQWSSQVVHPKFFRSGSRDRIEMVRMILWILVPFHVKAVKVNRLSQILNKPWRKSKIPKLGHYF